MDPSSAEFWSDDVEHEAAKKLLVEQINKAVKSQIEPLLRRLQALEDKVSRLQLQTGTPA
jgi:hypothetical protein